MIGFQHTWWRLASFDIICSWFLDKGDFAALFVAAALTVLWIARQPRTVVPALFWFLMTAALCGAGNGFTLLCAWMLGTLATLVLFQASREGGQRGLYTFALAGALADVLFLLGYLLYCGVYRDSFLPTEEQFLEASLSLTTFPSKAFAASAMLAILVRVAVGAGSLWLPGEPPLQAREFLAQRIAVLLLPSAVLFNKLSFLRREAPKAGLILVLVLSIPAIVGGIAHALNRPLPWFFNPAQWFDELVQKPLRSIILFIDRRLEARTLDAVLVLPTRLARAGGVWISLLQSGSLASYLTLSVLGMAALFAWVSWGAK